MRRIPGDHAEVVLAKFGFKSKTFKIIEREDLIIALEPNEGLSALYEAKAKDRKWQRLYKRFEKAILGESDNSKQVEVLNPEAVELSKIKDGSIVAVMQEPLQIRNNSTGYQLYFFFGDNITIDGQDAQYNGVPYFVELEAQNDVELMRWEKNRRLTYQGSLQHFIYAFISNRHKEEGYEVSLASRDPGSGKFIKGADVSLADLYADGKLSFDNYLRVKYLKEKPHNNFINSFTTTTRFGTRSRNGQVVENLFMENIPDRDGQVSYLFSRKSSLLINDQAVLQNPEFLLEFGYWSWERISELMPIEYHLEYIKGNQ